MDESTIIAIDHGNSEIKTVHERFPAGFKMYMTRPPFITGKDQSLFWNGKWYALTRDRLPYRRDKSINDDYFILTLFAIGKELARADIAGGNVSLAVGLPPAYIHTLKDAFIRYLKRDHVPFFFGDKQYSIDVKNVYLYPQCWAAITPRISEIEKMPSCTLVDIGGYTVDIVRLIAGGYSNKEIGRSLHLSEGTVKNYVTELLSRLDCRDRTHLVLTAIRRRLI